jgi:ammonium transporter, Amt family
VAVTPAAGFVAPLSAIAIGALAAFPSYFVILWRARTSLDDSLDVFAAHGVGGIVGAMLTGLFAQTAWNAPAAGAIDGGWALVGHQGAAVAATFVYSAGMTYLLLKAIDLLLGLRRSRREEGVGMDIVQHGEEAYNRGEGAILLLDRRGERQTTAGSQENQP